MSSFIDPLNVTELTDTGDSIWRIDTIFRYQSDIAGIITVPVGFKTDFASVPRIGWIYAMDGFTANEPATIHDFLYYSGMPERDICDKILLEAMGVIGMPWYRRWSIYWGVRLGGWVAWNDHRKKGDPQAA